MGKGNMRRISLCITLLASLIMILASTPVRCDIVTLTISTPINIFIEIDGAKHYGRSFSVPIGSRVRILSDIVYEAMDIRYRFSFWLKNTAVLTNESCITVSDGGVQYIAVYEKEYLVRITSEPLLLAESFWVKEGSRLSYTAPKEIKLDEVVYRFSMWSGEIISTNNSTIETIVTRPVTFKALYIPCYPLYIGDRLVGYFQSGYTYYHQEDIEEHDGVKRVLENLIVIGGTAIKISSGLFAITIRERVNAIPAYTTFYKVTIEMPYGTSSVWVEEGTSYTLTAPQTITIEDVMYTFVKWEGDIAATTPTCTVQVNEPIHAKAVYKKMYKVTVISPTGEKVRWAEEGKALLIYETPEFNRIITSRVLRGFLVDGVMHELIAPGVLKLDDVRGPVTAIAIYEDQIVWINIAIITFFLTIIVVAYFLLSKHYGKSKEGKIIIHQGDLSP